jgi:hypothetical protein
VWTGPFVATTRPSAHAFRMHASHAARNLQHGRGMCRAQAWDGVSQANSVRSPPPCGEQTEFVARADPIRTKALFSHHFGLPCRCNFKSTARRSRSRSNRG